MEAGVTKILGSGEESVFPLVWCVEQRLCSEFCARTKGHLSSLLGEIDSPETADVSILLRALQKTIAFETEYSVKFGEEAGDTPGIDKDGDGIEEGTAEAIKRKYARAELSRSREALKTRIAEERSKSGGGLQCVDLMYITISVDCAWDRIAIV